MALDGEYNLECLEACTPDATSTRYRYNRIGLVSSHRVREAFLGLNHPLLVQDHRLPASESLDFERNLIFVPLDFSRQSHQFFVAGLGKEGFGV